MSDTRELYQELILDHHKRPRNFHKLEKANRQASGFNPLCGDRVSVYMRVEADVITDIGFVGTGCAISTASASMMTETIKGRTQIEAKAIFEHFHRLLTDSVEAADPAVLGKLAVFSGVREYPVRVKCATLVWHTMRAALDGCKETVATE